MFAPYNIEIFAEVLVLYFLEDLGSSKDCYGIGRQRQSVAAAHVTRMAFGEKCKCRKV